ncbi:MAG: peptide ligase PGM1-related protein, partial [Candidatus Competibacterales bacterium]|nr:peptide ligase PGM1-related protein [Candidatus Competibacterales bacterium]
ELKQRHPDLGQAVVKLDEGFSGEGNALFDYDGLAADAGLERRIREELPRRLGFTADQETWDDYRSKLEQMGGIVECFVDGAENRSPSVQCRIDPRGRIELISTHEQVLGGPSNQIFLGCLFPADAHYRQDLQEAGLRIAAALRDQGVIGRFGVDFVACREQDRWRLHALEINLRKGGTTHTYMMLQYLTDGRYDPETGLYRTRNGQPRYYYATDNLHSDAYRGLTPEDLIDIAVEHGLHFHGASQQGVVFHLIGALSEFGKLGMVCVADSEDNALRLQRDTIAVLDSETGGRRV